MVWKKNIQWAAVMWAKNALLMRGVIGEKARLVDLTGRTWLEGDWNANNNTLQQWYAEEHLWTHQSLIGQATAVEDYNV